MELLLLGLDLIDPKNKTMNNLIISVCYYEVSKIVSECKDELIEMVTSAN